MDPTVPAAANMDAPLRCVRRSDWVNRHLNMDRSVDVSVFETNIRVVGGLLAAYDMTNDKLFLDKAAVRMIAWPMNTSTMCSRAQDCADRLLFAFDTRTGVPHGSVNLHSHSHRNAGWTGGASILSEFGTMSVEFYYLSRHTGNVRVFGCVDASRARWSLRAPCRRVGQVRACDRSHVRGH